MKFEKKVGSLLAALLFGSGLAAPAICAPVVLPTGLNAGDQYRLAFVTNAIRDAQSTDINDYNTFVTNVANSQTELAGLGTTWTAIASTPTVDARTNTATDPTPPGNTGVPIFLLNNTMLAAHYDDLWDGTVLNPLEITEDGSPHVSPFPFSFVWTGTFTDGTNSDPTLALGGTFVIGALTGNPTVTSGFGWIEAFPSNIENEYSLYAMSDILTAPTTIAEPGVLALFGIGVAGLMITRRRRAA
tara:strand:+ start:353 stop:1084 length:732 start_codon:yes stop_codon:yes gene_type:complete